MGFGRISVCKWDNCFRRGLFWMAVAYDGRHFACSDPVFALE